MMFFEHHIATLRRCIENKTEPSVPGSHMKWDIKKNRRHGSDNKPRRRASGEVVNYLKCVGLSYNNAGNMRRFIAEWFCGEILRRCFAG